MPGFHTVCRVDELADGQSRVAEIDRKLVAVFRDGDHYHAIDDVCPHMGAALSEGTVEDGIVTCPWHAWRFRLADGAWADSPRVKIGCYLVRIHGDEVQVQVRAPETSGPSEREDGGALSN